MTKSSLGGDYKSMNDPQEDTNFTTMSVPEQQKALIIPSAGAPLSVESIEVPQPGAGEVLVRAEAVGLNPVDWKAHEFGITLTNYPAILGCEVAGVVVKVGSQVTNRAIGDTV